MLKRLGKALGYAFGRREITIVRDSHDCLELAYGQLLTVFDRKAQRILQDGRLAAALPLVERVELHQPMHQEGTVNWFITVHVRGARLVEVGQVTDETDASIIAARIAGITDRKVTVYPRPRT
jgi:hypothetical protein